MSVSNKVLNINGHHNNLVMIQPTNFAELDRYCTLISKSSFCPRAFAGKPGDVMIALQMGAEVGLSPMQAIQNIAVINGKPCLWGDGALAVTMASPHYQYHKEWLTGDLKDETLTAHCTIKRKGSEDYTYSFGIQDAKKAGLWGKQGVWQQYPARMLQNRARGFALRDKFADALRGINIREEVEDYIKVKDITPVNNDDSHRQASEHQKQLTKQMEEEQDFSQLELDFVEFMASIHKSENEEQLKTVFTEIKKTDFKAKPDLMKKLIAAKDKKKLEVIKKSAFNAHSNMIEAAVNAGDINPETGEVVDETQSDLAGDR